MIRIIAIGIVTAVTALEAHVLTVTTQPDKDTFGFFEPVEITSEIRVSGNSLEQAYPEGISGNVVYEVEYILRGTYLPVRQSLSVCGHYLWNAKVENVTRDNTPLTATMDLRILYHFAEPGRYRVRGKYRSDHRSSTFEKVSDWSEFEIKPKTEREVVIFEEFELVGTGRTDAEQLASYEAFAAKYPTEYLTAAVYREMDNSYYKAGDIERRLDLLKKLINSPIISRMKRRLYAYGIGDLEEKNGHVDEAIRWYRQAGLLEAEFRIAQLQGKAE